MRNYDDRTGFASPAERALGKETRTLALAELTATIALALGTAVIAIALSAGSASADVIDGVIGHEDSVFIVALLLGLAFLSLGGFAAMPHRRRHRR